MYSLEITLTTLRDVILLTRKNNSGAISLIPILDFGRFSATAILEILCKHFKEILMIFTFYIIFSISNY